MGRKSFNRFYKLTLNYVVPCWLLLQKKDPNCRNNQNKIQKNKGLHPVRNTLCICAGV
jgi:hypothetical protein